MQNGKRSPKQEPGNEPDIEGSALAFVKQLTPGAIVTSAGNIYHTSGE